MVKIALGTLGVYWLLAAFVLAMDPYDIYPWGPVPRIEPKLSTQDNTYVVRALAKDPNADLLLVGSSVSMLYTPAMLRQKFSAARYPVNFSYGSPRPYDRNVVLESIAQYSTAKRVIIWFDYMYAWPALDEVEGFPSYMYDSSLWNDLRMVNQKAVASSAGMLFQRPVIDTTISANVGRDTIASYRVAQSAKSLNSLRSAATAIRANVTQPHFRDCRDVAAVAQLVSSVKRLALQGRTVSVIFPAYSQAFYYYASNKGLTISLMDQMLARRCLVQGLPASPRVAVYALDKDLSLTANLANYVDPGHLYGESALMRALGHIDDLDYQITKTNVDSYIADLNQRVRRYKIFSSEEHR